MAVLACYGLGVAIVPHPLRYGSPPPEEMLSRVQVINQIHAHAQSDDEFDTIYKV